MKKICANIFLFFYLNKKIVSISGNFGYLCIAMSDDKLHKISDLKHFYLSSVGFLIKEYRNKKLVTQENLGSMIGVRKAQVCKIESGKNLTIDTIMRVFDALGAKVRIYIEGDNTPAQSRQKVEHIVKCVSLFSELFAMSPKQAYNYLLRFGGIDFLDSYFETNSSFSVEIAVNKMYMACKRNGGGL